MSLFDEVDRTDLSPASYTELEYEFLNRSARPEVATIRKILDEWYVNFPDKNYKLKSRFQSRKKDQFQGAFFELYLHALLTAFDCIIEVEPDGITGTKPDFFVHSPTGEKFFLEATVATDVSADEAASNARMNEVFDAVNRMSSPDFFIGMKLDGRPKTPPSAKAIRKFLQEHLSELNPDKVIIDYEAKGNQGLPHWKYEHDGWKITFYPIPKWPEAREKADVRPIGVQSRGFERVNTTSAIRKSVERKATKYGKLNCPYIVAVNVFGWSLDRDDVVDALFGTVQAIVRYSEVPPPVEYERARDGVWVAPNGIKNTRVSAVLIGKSISPWSLGISEIMLFHNPWAEYPYNDVLTELSEALPKDGKIAFKDGKSPASVLKLNLK